MYIDIKTNIPEIIKFKFDTFKKWENTSQAGKPYVSYSIGTEWKGQDAYFSLFESDYLKAFAQLDGQLKDRTLEIEKVEGDGGRKYWVIKENGNDITPQNAPQPQNTPTQSIQTPPVSSSEAKEPFNYILSAIKKLNENQTKIIAEITKIKEEQKSTRTLLVDLKGEPAVSLHESTTAETEEEKIPIIEEDVKIEDL